MELFFATIYFTAQVVFLMSLFLVTLWLLYKLVVWSKNGKEWLRNSWNEAVETQLREQAELQEAKKTLMPGDTVHFSSSNSVPIYQMVSDTPKTGRSIPLSQWKEPYLKHGNPIGDTLPTLRKSKKTPSSSEK
jgi:hypothetical protein